MCTLRIGPNSFLVTQADFQSVVGRGLGEFCGVVEGVHCRVSDFTHKVVVHRRVEAVRGWRSWLREDPLVHPYKWLRPDMALPAPSLLPPFLRCEPYLTPGVLGFWLIRPGLMRNFEKLDFPSSAVLGKWKPVGGIRCGKWMVGCPYCMRSLSLPPLVGEDLAEVVRRNDAE